MFAVESTKRIKDKEIVILERQESLDIYTALERGKHS